MTGSNMRKVQTSSTNDFQQNYPLQKNIPPTPTTTKIKFLTPTPNLPIPPPPAKTSRILPPSQTGGVKGAACHAMTVAEQCFKIAQSPGHWT